MKSKWMLLALTVLGLVSYVGCGGKENQVIVQPEMDEEAQMEMFEADSETTE